jgi:hypothetical protein
MRAEIRSLIAAATAVFLLGPAVDASSDEAPIAGVVKSVDASAGTFLVESTIKGKVPVRGARSTRTSSSRSNGISGDGAILSAS